MTDTRTDEIRLDLFASVYERSGDEEWRERAAAVRRLRGRVEQVEAALRQAGTELVAGREAEARRIIQAALCAGVKRLYESGQR